MQRRLALFVLAAVVVGAAGWFILQEIGSQAARPQTPAAPVPALSPADLAALTAKAASGDPGAQTRLAWIYQRGAGVKPDQPEAAKWFQRAAKQGDPDSLAALGEMTQAGQGMPRDLKEAARLFRLAAEKGSVTGQYDLAYLYERGRGVEKNEREAAKWYELAAEGGSALAQYDIGQRYRLGVGVPINRARAYKWLKLAADQGQADSERLLRALRSEMSGAEIAQGNQLVKEFGRRPAVGK